MEPEETTDDAVEASIPDASPSVEEAGTAAPTPPKPAQRAAPRPRKPRTAAAAAASTTAAPRANRGRPAAPRSTSSRSASTGAAARTRRKAAVPPENRATAADALVELPEPEVAAPQPPEAEAPAQRVIAPEVEAEPEPELIEPAPIEEAPVEEAPIEEAPDTPAVVPTFAELGITGPAHAAPVAAPETVAAPQLTTAVHPEAERAADAAFSDLVGSRPLPAARDTALELSGLTKRYGSVTAVDGIDLRVPVGSFYGIVGPNGAGKTTTLSMVAGMLRPDEGTVAIYGHDLTADAAAAKRALGVLPDRLRLFDRLTGAQLLHYAGSLRGLDRATIARRSTDLAVAFGLSSSLGRPVSDYSVGMTKKIAIAAALIHAPRMLVLDEPFESVDPVSAAAVLHVLRRFTEAGGTVVLSSHSMELIESTCDALAIIVAGRILAAGPTAEVLAGVTLEDRFVELAGGRSAVEGMEWLHSYAAD